jgi:hypothetical protein
MGLCGLPDVARKGDAGWIWGGDAQAADGEWGAPVLKGLGSPGSRWAMTWQVEGGWGRWVREVVSWVGAGLTWAHGGP